MNILILAALLTGCASPMGNVGKMADEQFVVKAVPAKEKSGTWQTGQVQIDYSIEQLGSTFVPAGTFLIKDSVLLTFNAAKYLHVYLIYIDSEGMAISTHDISPNIGYLTVIEGKYKLPRIPTAPEGAAAFTFSYWGNLVSEFTSDSQSGDWEIYFNPFQ